MDNEKPWYDDLTSEEDKFYAESVNRIKSAVKDSGMTFEQAAGLVETGDADLKGAILDDALKVLMAEMHFHAGKSLQEVAKALDLPTERLERARAEMIADIEQTAIEKYKSETGQEGNA